MAASQRWERQILAGADYEDLDIKLVSVTARMALKSGRWEGSPKDPREFLHDFGLMAHGGITNAALVLYGKHPVRILPQARVRLLGSAEGKTGGAYAIDRMFEDCLLHTAEELSETLALYTGGVTSSFSPANWQRDDRMLFPARAALREGIMNALVHRDYESNAAITIIIQPGSLKITNPGGLPNDLKLADLRRDHFSFPRNPDIAHICYLFGLIEKVGRGTQRILEDCRQSHLKEPRWNSSVSETSLTIFASTQRPRNLNRRQSSLLELLRTHAEMTVPELVNALETGITGRTVRNDLAFLIDQGFVETLGRGRSTVYKALRKQ